MSDMDDLKQRLERANTALLELAEEANAKSDYDNKWRLENKADGVRLALSYANEYDSDGGGTRTRG